MTGTEKKEEVLSIENMAEGKLEHQDLQGATNVPLQGHAQVRLRRSVG